MDVIRHDHVASDSDVVFGLGFMSERAENVVEFGSRQHWCARRRIERHKIERPHLREQSFETKGPSIEAIFVGSYGGHSGVTTSWWACLRRLSAVATTLARTLHVTRTRTLSSRRAYHATHGRSRL